MTQSAGAARFRRPARPLFFPVEATVPESKRHLILRTFLFRILKLAFGSSSCLGSDQFVYWNASDPKRCLAPDVFLKLGTPDQNFDSWKTWERGTPELCVEIVSEHETESWDAKLARYHELGAREVVRFDADAEGRHRLRVWNRVEDDLVEREDVGSSARSLVLAELFWVIDAVEGYPAGLRLSRDPDGERLLFSPEEEQRRRAERAERKLARLERTNGRARRAKPPRRRR